MLAVAFAVAACGHSGPQPMSFLSGDQQAQFERTNARLIELNTPSTEPLKPRLVQATAACTQLDKTEPLLRALSTTCLPQLQRVKLVNMISGRCKDAGPCQRLFRRISAALESDSLTQRSYTDVAQQLVREQACIEAITQPVDQILVTQHASKKATSVADALARGSKSGFKAAGAAFANTMTGVRLAADRRPPTVRIPALREACHLKAASDD